MRMILSIMLLCFGLMVFAVDQKSGDTPQLIDVELVNTTGIQNDCVVSYSDVVVINNIDSEDNGLNDIVAITQPSPQRAHSLPGIDRTVKSDHRIEPTESFKGEVFSPHRLGYAIYDPQA